MSDYFQEWMKQYIPSTQPNVPLSIEQSIVMGYAQSILLRNQLKQLLKDKNDLLSQIEKLETNHTQTESFDERKKRLRSLAWQIERSFACPITLCGKKYGSEGSLNQHIKLKHPELINKL